MLYYPFYLVGAICDICDGQNDPLILLLLLLLILLERQNFHLEFLKMHNLLSVNLKLHNLISSIFLQMNDF